MKTEDILEIRDLRTYFHFSEGIVKAVDGITLNLNRKETVGLVGESGSGKTVTALSIMRLIPTPPGRIYGEILFNGENLLSKSEAEMQNIRGNKIAMIFQDPATSLNPVMRVGEQIVESLMTHRKITKSQAVEKSLELMELVGIPSASKRIREYPHMLSSGMRQRLMIAIALACDPVLLIADEPTTALDVITQAQVLELLKNLKKRLSSILYITHDLGIVAEICDKVAIIYAGKILEYADVYSLFQNPLHPYTQGLLQSITRIDGVRRRLKPIPGFVPDPLNPPSGCRFHPRCPIADGRCVKEEPRLVELKQHHTVACFKVI
jgi:oligopeptide/dipeptide ABC transporter ATP-binding protein